MKIIIALVPFITSCAHQKKSFPESPKSYSQSLQQLNLDSSFAFTLNGHNYHFVAAQTPGYADNCWRFDGYKDDQLTYSFSDENFKKLSAVYQSNDDISIKIQKALRQIEAFSPRIYACIPAPAYKPSPLEQIDMAAGEAMTWIIYGSMAVLVSPLWVPAMINDSVIERDVHKKLLKIKLGFTYAEVNEIMKSPSKSVKSSDYLVQSFEFTKSFDQYWKN